MDHEFVPQRGEFGLLEAAQWGACFEEVGPEQWPALCAWVESGAHVVEGHGPIPSISDFEERYCGHWSSFKEYAEQLADDTGLQQDWPEEAVRYFNWSSWVSDLKFDYTVVDAPRWLGGGVMSSATSSRERGRVIGVLESARQLLDALCDACAPCTGGDLLTDTQFDQLMLMSDRRSRLADDVSRS